MSAAPLIPEFATGEHVTVHDRDCDVIMKAIVISQADEYVGVRVADVGCFSVHVNTLERVPTDAQEAA